jgi:hypothetical protein
VYCLTQLIRFGTYIITFQTLCITVVGVPLLNYPPLQVDYFGKRHFENKRRFRVLDVTHTFIKYTQCDEKRGSIGFNSSDRRIVRSRI